MQSKQKNPCDTCRRDLCLDRDCPRWKKWFKSNWNKTVKNLRKEAWKQQDDIGKQRHPTKFVYKLSQEMTDPCKGCICEPWCDKPCSQRFAWWKHRIGMVRKNLMGGDLK